MATTKKDLYTIFSIKMANWLIRQGYDMIGAVDSPKDPSGYYKAFLFEDSDALQHSISEYNNMIKKGDITKYEPTTNIPSASYRRKL